MFIKKNKNILAGFHQVINNPCDSNDSYDPDLLWKIHNQFSDLENLI